MRFLNRLWETSDRREIEKLSMELGLILGPQLFHGQDGLPGLAPTMVEVTAHNLGFFPQPASTDAENKPAVGQAV